MGIKVNVYCDKCGREIPMDEGTPFFEISNDRVEDGTENGYIVTTKIKAGLLFTGISGTIIFTPWNKIIKTLCIKCAKEAE